MRSLSIYAAHMLLLSSIALVGAENADIQSAETVSETITVNSNLPDFTLSIERRHKSAENSEITIRVTGGPKSYQSQTLTTSIEDKLPITIDTIDFNFDGYKDFRIASSQGNHGDTAYSCWRFDPKRQTFKPAPEFDLIAEVDIKRKLLISTSSGGIAYWNQYYYRLSNGVPKLVESIETGYARNLRAIIPANYSDDQVMKITKIYEDGKLMRTYYTDKIP